MTSTARTSPGTARKLSSTATTPSTSTRARGEGGVCVYHKITAVLQASVTDVVCTVAVTVWLDYFMFLPSGCRSLWDKTKLYWSHTGENSLYKKYRVITQLLFFLSCCRDLFLNLQTVTLTQVNPDVSIKPSSRLMSKLSIVLDLRLLGKMWLGTRDEQTPQPVRRTLGNTGPAHLLLPLRGPFSLAFTVVHWCIHGLLLEICSTWNQFCFHLWFHSDWSLLCCWVTSPLGLFLISIRLGWQNVIGETSDCVVEKQSAQFQPCDSVVCRVGCGLWSSAFFISSPLTWAASRFLVASTGGLYPHWLSASPTAWRWSTAACHRRRSPSCGPTSRGGWVKARCSEAWETSPLWNSGNHLTCSHKKVLHQ